MGNRSKLSKILLTCAFVAASLLPSCEKEEPIVEPPKDTTAPKIKILSPVDEATYFGTRWIPIQWEIEDEKGDFKSAWYSINNGGKISLPSKSGSIDRYFKKDNNTIAIGAEDIHSNASKKSNSFYIGHLFIK